MKIIVCDDYLLNVNSLLRDIQRIAPNAACQAFTDSAEAMEYVKTHDVDVALLDINMPNVSGLTLARAIVGKNEKANIIFVTGHPEYALEAHELYASSFLLKPITFDSLKKAFDNLRNPVNNLNDRTISHFYNGKSNLGKNIRAMRIKKNLSVQEFSDKIGVTPQTVYRWEKNERMPDVVNFMLIADVFGIDAHELLK